jgi:hypothetical protein
MMCYDYVSTERVVDDYCLRSFFFLFQLDFFLSL